MRSMFFALAVLFVPAAVAAQQADSVTQAEVRAVVHAYHSSLAAADSAGALALLLPDVVIYESGHAETLAEYRSGHLRSDIRFAAATQRVIQAEAVSVWGDVALYTGRARTTGRWRDRDVDSAGTETMVLVRTPAGWRIRHIHWS